MGSTNPVFILPGALAERAEQIAAGLKNSTTLGVGQFCTNPGLTIVPESKTADQFVENIKNEFAASSSATMLTQNIKNSYEAGLNKLQTQVEVELLAKGKNEGKGAQGVPHIMKTTAEAFLENKSLEEEVFGPSTLLIKANSKAEMLQMAARLEGHLTATLFGTEEDLKENADLLSILERKVGRLIINNFPTGVEVCHSMVHGGPFPATTDARMTSVGTGAITRFTRPICYQNFPPFLLPPSLQDENPLNIWRLVNGNWKR